MSKKITFSHFNSVHPDAYLFSESASTSRRQRRQFCTDPYNRQIDATSTSSTNPGHQFSVASHLLSTLTSVTNFPLVLWLAGVTPTYATSATSAYHRDIQLILPLIRDTSIALHPKVWQLPAQVAHSSHRTPTKLRRDITDFFFRFAGIQTPGSRSRRVISCSTPEMETGILVVSTAFSCLTTLTIDTSSSFSPQSISPASDTNS